MANTFAPFGFRPFGDQEGAAPTMGLTRYALASSDTNLYFTGDVVSVSTGSGSPAGYITLTASGLTLTNPILGIFAGCEYYSPTVGRVVWSSFFPGNVGSSNPGNAYVITDPNQLFLVQGTTTAVLGTSNIGMTIGFASSLQATGNQLSGISNIALNSSTVNSSNALAFRIIDTSSNYAPPGTNGADGTSAGAVMVVGFSNQGRRALTQTS
jgi:hypothetical protein